MTVPEQAPYDTDDLVWCARCKRPGSVGEVLQDRPYTTANSRLLVAASGRGCLVGSGLAR
jgi:hypothetical protein